MKKVILAVIVTFASLPAFAALTGKSSEVLVQDGSSETLVSAELARQLGADTAELMLYAKSRLGPSSGDPSVERIMHFEFHHQEHVFSGVCSVRVVKLIRQFSLYGCSYISVGARGDARVALDPFVLENVIRLR